MDIVYIWCFLLFVNWCVSMPTFRKLLIIKLCQLHLKVHVSVINFFLLSFVICYISGFIQDEFWFILFFLLKYIHIPFWLKENLVLVDDVMYHFLKLCMKLWFWLVSFLYVSDCLGRRFGPRLLGRDDSGVNYFLHAVII